MSPAVKKLLLGTLIVLSLGAAAYFHFRNSGASAYPDDQGEAGTWMCDKCGRHLELTPRRVQEWIASPDRLRRDPNAPAKQLVFWCDACKTYTVCGAVQCSRHQTWYLPFGPDGEERQCPDCQRESGRP